MHLHLGGRHKGKFGKGRQDKYYHLAKEQGYRSRAAYKLIQLNRQYNFLSGARVLLDLCAAPGGWLQVASKFMPVSSVIIGVDLVPIKAIQNVTTFTEDITTESCRATLRKKLGRQKCDVVIHDGAPNMGKAWLHDAYGQAELTLHSLHLAADFLRPGGVFVSKVFRSSDYNSLLWVFKQLFKRVEATKPPASRNTSAEIFVVCQGFLAPKKVDPRIFDPTWVFKALEGEMSKKSLFSNKVNKEGYKRETVYKEKPVADFVEKDKPIPMLAELYALTWDDERSQRYAEHRDTKEELKLCCQDLRVLGKHDFQKLLRWRERMRKHFHLDDTDVEANNKNKASEGGDGHDAAAMTPEDQDALLEKELEDDLLELKKETRRARKRRNKLRRKRVERMNLGMHHTISTTDIGGEYADPTIFSLSSVKNANDFDTAMLTADVLDSVRDDIVLGSSSSSEDSDEDSSDLDELYDSEELWEKRAAAFDKQYLDFLKRRNIAHADWDRAVTSGKTGKRPKKKRRTAAEAEADARADFVSEAQEKARLLHEEEERSKHLAPNPLVITEEQLDPDAPEIRTRHNVASWFSQDIFGDFALPSDNTLEDDAEFLSIPPTSPVEDAIQSRQDQEEEGSRSDVSDAEDVPEFDTSSEEDDHAGDGEHTRGQKRKKHDKGYMDEAGGFEVVPMSSDDEDQWEEIDKPSGDESSELEYDSDAATYALAYARKVMRDNEGKLKLSKIVDDSYNRWTYGREEKAPLWLEHEEEMHEKPQLPVSKQDIEELKLRKAALDARPLKKVVEAKARKRKRIQAKMAKVKESAQKIAQSTDMNDREKLRNIERLVRRQIRTQKTERVYVVRKKFQRNMKIPRAPGSRIKCVDGRLKADKRGRKNFERKKAKRQKNRNKKAHGQR